MKKLFISLLVFAICVVFVPRSYAETRDFWTSSYGSWVYWSDIQNSNNQSQGYHEINISLGDISLPIMDQDKFIVVEYQFKQPYSGTLAINYNYNVQPMYKFASGNLAWYDYTSSNSVHIGLNHCTYFYLVLVGSPSNFVSGDIKVNSITYNITPDSDNTVAHDYTNTLNSINGILGYINTSLDNIESYTNDIEGYINSVEPILETVSSLLTNIYNSNSTFQGQTLTNINSVNTYLSNISNKINSLDINVSSILTSVNSINSSVNTVLSILNKTLIDVPVYSLSAIYLFGGHHTNLLLSNGINWYFNANDIKNEQFRGYGNGYYIVYGTNYYNAVIDSIDSGTCTLVKQVYTYNFYWKMYYVTGTSNWWQFDISYLDNQSDAYIVPLYFGFGNFPDEVSSIMGLSNSTNDLLQQVISAIEDISVNINVQPEVSVDLSNIGININNIQPYSYSAYDLFSNGNYNLVKNNGVFNYYSADDIKNKQWRGYGNGYYLIYGSNYYNANIDSITSGTVTLVRHIFSYNFYWKMYYIEGTNGWYNMDMSYLDNNSNAFIVPLYYGNTGNLPESVLNIFGIKSDMYNLINGLSIANKLDAINQSINQLDLSVSVDVTNDQIQNVTNNFDANIDLVNNVEVNFNNSFDSSNDLITNNDLTLDFEGLTPSLELYHGIFTSFYDIPLFKYVVIICLVGGAVLVLLG